MSKDALDVLLERFPFLLDYFDVQGDRSGAEFRPGFAQE
jgi:hypothetical protein